MRSAFGVVHKGLPSALRTSRGTLKPLSEARVKAHELGRRSGQLKAQAHTKQSGWTNQMLTSGQKRNAGRNARELSRAQGWVSKGLRPANVRALERAAIRGKDYRTANYAEDKLALRVAKSPKQSSRLKRNMRLDISDLRRRAALP